MKTPGVVFHPENLTIIVQGEWCDYELDLERANTPSELLDWIFQITQKTWMTPELTYQFLRALNEACRAVFRDGIQGTYCPWGSSRKVDWRKGKSLAGR